MHFYVSTVDYKDGFPIVLRIASEDGHIAGTTYMTVKQALLLVDELNKTIARVPRLAEAADLGIADRVLA